MKRTLRERDTSHQSRRKEPDFVGQGGGVMKDAEIVFGEVSRLAAWHKFRCGGVYWVLSRLLRGEVAPFDLPSSLNCSASDDSASS